MEGLGVENILTQEEANDLFTESEEEEVETSSEKKESSEDNLEENNKEHTETTEINPEELFGESEGVGSEDDIEDEEDANSEKDNSTSPKNDFFSSIANALYEDGIFLDLDADEINKVKSPKDFRDLIENQIKAGLDEKQKRIDNALNVGVEPNVIKQYENTLAYLNNIDDSTITDESDKGESLRKNLIYQDFINRGYSEERAKREIKKSFDAGSDIEDAKEALSSNKEFFKNSYATFIKSKEEERELEVKERERQANELKKSILEDDKVFGDLQVDKSTRKKVYENISSPVYKDPETGELYTAIQKYEMENRTDFLKKVGLIFTLTNDFKDFDGLIKGKVKKEVNKGLSRLEKTLNNTSRNSDGSIKFVGSRDEDPESFLDFNIDI